MSHLKSFSKVALGLNVKKKNIRKDNKRKNGKKQGAGIKRTRYKYVVGNIMIDFNKECQNILHILAKTWKSLKYLEGGNCKNNKEFALLLVT